MDRTHENSSARVRNAARIAAAIGCAMVVASGCEHASPNDPSPPGGGQRYVMSHDVFVTQIDPILSAQGCDNTTCHGGGIRGTFQLSPANDKDPDFDYSQASLQVVPTDPAASPLVAKPVDEECGGTAHAGGKFFHSLDDPDYLAILAWIEGGEYR